jgi:ketosteroid isomerase-like protein
MLLRAGLLNRRRKLLGDQLDDECHARLRLGPTPLTSRVSFESEAVTAKVVDRFIEAFRQKDDTAIADLVAQDCVMETIQPAPDGERVEGFDANVRFWRAMITDPNGSFETEDVLICRDRAINRWRYRFGEGDENSVRGVTLIHVRGGKIVEALAYAKTSPRTALGQDRENPGR